MKMIEYRARGKEAKNILEFLKECSGGIPLYVRDMEYTFNESYTGVNWYNKQHTMFKSYCSVFLDEETSKKLKRFLKFQTDVKN